MQNPMAEILNLWHEKNWKNATFYIPLHHLQDKVRTDNLKKKLERVAIEMVNAVGNVIPL
jgi:transcriptional accessory protein Tex/SPT6